MFMLRVLDRGPTQGAIAVTIGAVLVAGCGPGGYSGPTGTVSGTVTLNGEAVPQGCSVAFVSDEGYTASGTVEAGGNYQLSVVTADGRSNDIPAATYKVSVGPPAGAETSDADYDAMMDQSASGQPESAAGPEQGTIPAKFQAAATSGLSFDVKEGPNTINIELQ
jgi:type 1 fimbria pilin